MQQHRLNVMEQFMAGHRVNIDSVCQTRAVRRCCVILCLMLQPSPAHIAAFLSQVLEKSNPGGIYFPWDSGEIGAVDPLQVSRMTLRSSRLLY